MLIIKRGLTFYYLYSALVKNSFALLNPDLALVTINTI